MKKHYGLDKEAIITIQLLSGVVSGAILAFIWAFLHSIFQWEYISSVNLEVLFLTYSLFLYPIGVWAGIYISARILKIKQYFWLSLSGLFLSVSIFLIYASLVDNRNFYFYWGLFYTLSPLLVILGDRRLFLKKA